CTEPTALPEGSFWLRKDASHANASGVLQATEGTEGTVRAAESDGKCSWKIRLYKYSSLFLGGLIGNFLSASANSCSLTFVSACAFKVSIQLYPTPSERSEEHTSELQSRENLVCRLVHEKKNLNHPYLTHLATTSAEHPDKFVLQQHRASHNVNCCIFQICTRHLDLHEDTALSHELCGVR